MCGKALHGMSLKIIINNLRFELALNVLNYVAVHSPIPIFIWLAFTVVVALCYHDKVFFKVALNDSQVNIVWPGPADQRAGRF